MFISEILSPECVVLGTETDLGKKNMPCYMFCGPQKLTKSYFRPIFGMFY